MRAGVEQLCEAEGRPGRRGHADLPRPPPGLVIDFDGVTLSPIAATRDQRACLPTGAGLVTYGPGSFAATRRRPSASVSCSG